MNYYNKHIGDYAKDTAHLSMIEDGAYNRMMDTYYGMEKPLPLDREKLYRLVRARGATERKTVDAMLEEFFNQDSDGWHHKRCDEEIARAHEKSRKAKDSANNRWHSEGNAKALRTHNEGNANQQPRAKSQEPIAKEEPNPTAAGEPPPAEGLNGNAVAYIPLADGTEFGVSKEFLAELDAAYPRVDGPQTLKEIRVWCIANPRDRKTRKGAARFINSWFERVQNRGR